MKSKSLKDLQHIQQKLAEQQRLVAAEEAARLEAERHAHAEKNLFVHAAGAVRRIPAPQQSRLPGLSGDPR